MNNQNKKIGLLASAKVRLIAAIIAALALVGLVVGVVIYFHNKSTEVGAATVASAPSIQSVPGSDSASADYVSRQIAENQREAQKATQDAKSAVPTITRTDFKGNLDQFTDATNKTTRSSIPMTSRECPIKKAEVMFKPNPANCLPKNLTLARQAGVTAEELRCQGCACSSLKLAGFTSGELKSTGYEASELKTCGFNLNQLANAGYSAADLKAAGFSAKQLGDAGYSPGQLKAAGYSDKAIKSANFTPEALAAAGVGVKTPGQAIAAAKLAKSQGKTAADLKKKGLSAAALKAAGYTASELRAAGFTPTQLHKAGFSAGDLKKAGFNTKELKAAGIGASALKRAGFGDSALSSAGFSEAAIKKADAASKSCNMTALKAAHDSGVSAMDMKNKGCGAAALKAAGYTAADLRQAGFDAKQLKNAGYSPKALHDAGFSAADLKHAGLSAKQLHDAGFSAADLKAAGFKPAELKQAGYSAADMKKAGYTANALKDAGFDAAALKDAGFPASDLKKSGFTPGQMANAGYTATQLAAAGETPQQLHDAGFSAAALKKAGFSAKALKESGYTDGDLLRAGYTPKQSGYSSAGGASQAGTGLTPAQAAILSKLASQQQAQASNTADASIPSASQNSTEGRLAAIARQEQAQMSQQERAAARQQEQAAMIQQAQHMLSDWSKTGSQSVTTAVPQANPVIASGGQNMGGGSAQASGKTVKAGTIMFAVLDTSIDTDESTPIMARIVDGPLKGSKLLGTFERTNKTVLLKFNMLNSPKLSKSIKINAVAIDPDTARTALGGQVNNHYLLRYGTLFASAFLQGFSNALTSSGSGGCNGSPVCFVTNPKSSLNTGGQVMMGLGKVGESYSQEMGSNFTRAPTVKIPGGTGFGLLIMSDLQLPESNK